ncbi:MAG: PAS domain S-box protein [Dehalococcoidia bacterium]|nr:PAS domain S-box protein [Dehalococcoidia bacterium]
MPDKSTLSSDTGDYLEAVRTELEMKSVLLDLAMDCQYVIDTDGNIIYVNDIGCRTYGYNAEELIGKKISVLNTPEQAAHISERITWLCEMGSAKFESHHQRKDGAVISVEIYSKLVTVRGQKYILCLARDLTERILADKVLKRSEERFRTVLEDMDNGYFELDSHGHYTFVNDAMCKILGLSRAEIVARHFSKFVDPSDTKFIDSSRVMIGDVATRGVTRSGVFGTIVKGEGSRRIIGISASPMRDAAGAITGVRGITRDITDRIKIEQQLLIASKLASIGELAAGVAHEINNPLTAIMGFSQLLIEEEGLPGRIKSDLEKIYNQSQRAARIVQNLLTFARNYTPEKNIIDINELIQKTLELRIYEHSVGNIEVIKELQDGLPGISADEHQMQQVLLNIIINAEHSIAVNQKAGSIKIVTGQVEDKVRIAVTDDGPGIPGEILNRLFDPFFTTKDVGQGTGLGLSVCHGIITNHGGRIYAESVMGEGATFVIELPVSKASSGRPAGEPAKLQKCINGSAAGKKVLVVDDETVIRDILTRVLSERGYSVDSASSGQEGLQKIESSEYDVYLLDIKMPGIDGGDMYEIIGSRYPHLTARVIFITGDTVTKTTLDFLESTRRQYFGKPLDFVKLINTVDEMVISA